MAAAAIEPASPNGLAALLCCRAVAKRRDDTRVLRAAQLGAWCGYGDGSSCCHRSEVGAVDVAADLPVPEAHVIFDEVMHLSGCREVGEGVHIAQRSQRSLQTHC